MKAKFILLWITVCVFLSSCSNQDSNLLLPMIVDGQYGYIDEFGKVVIEPQFKYAGVFADGLACVRTYEGYGYINKRGKMVIDPIFDDANDFSDGYAVVRLDEKKYFIDKRFSGKKDLKSSGFSWIDGFSEGLAAVEKNGKWGYVNTKGEMVISPKYYEARSFKEGFARVKISDSDSNGWTYINKSGSKITDLPLSYDCEDFSEGLARIEVYDKNKGDSWHTFINKNGAVFKNKYERAYEFKEGLAPVETDEGWGYIDKNENFVIYPKERFHWAKEFSEGLAAVEIDYDPSEYKDNKYGYIDKSGNLVIRPKYDGASNFSKGLALVYNSDYKYGLIDKNGKVILDTKYNSILVMSDEWVEISVHKKLEGYKTGLAKTNGRIIVKPEYYSIKYLYDKYFRIVDNKKNSAYMDVNGNWLWAAPSFEIEVNRNNQSGTSESSANAAPKGLLYMKGSNNNGSSDNYFNNSDNSKENSNRNISRTKKTCGLCEGKGWIPSTTGPNFGQSDKWCSECNKTVPANHYHQTCPSCNGKKEW